MKKLFFGLIIYFNYFVFRIISHDPLFYVVWIFPPSPSSKRVNNPCLPYMLHSLWYPVSKYNLKFCSITCTINNVKWGKREGSKEAADVTFNGMKLILFEVWRSSDVFWWKMESENYIGSISVGMNDTCLILHKDQVNEGVSNFLS